MKLIAKLLLTAILTLSTVSQGCTAPNPHPNTNPSGSAYQTAEPPATQPSSDRTNGHECVDLGLSVKWATCNVGASSPSEYGDYYAWGEIATKMSYTEENYKANGMTMGDISGNSSYYVARAKWGGCWRMPTKAEMQELIDNCTWTWTTQDGYDGYQVTGKNGNSIFLPAAGNRFDTSIFNIGVYGGYWCSTRVEDDANSAYRLFFANTPSHCVDSTNNDEGRPVRPVCD